MLDGLRRPDGPVRIERTEMRSKNALVARLSGVARATVAVVSRRGKYYVVAPASLGGTRAVPGHSLTDALHGAVHDISARFGRPGRKPRCGAAVEEKK